MTTPMVFGAILFLWSGSGQYQTLATVPMADMAHCLRAGPTMVARSTEADAPLLVAATSMDSGARRCRNDRHSRGRGKRCP